MKELNEDNFAKSAKQTDYDKALIDSFNEGSDEYIAEYAICKSGVPIMYADGFHAGYMFGVGQRMEQTRKETKENEDAFASAPDNISQNISNSDIRSDKSLMRAEFAKAAMNALIQKIAWGRDYRRVSQMAVNFADALISELEKPREPCL